jgi:signal transduction histidine kinase
LGLAIARHIARQHSGGLPVNASELVCFKLTLPSVAVRQELSKV